MQAASAAAVASFVAVSMPNRGCCLRWMMLMMMTMVARPAEGFTLLFVLLIHYLCSTKFVELRPQSTTLVLLLPPTVASCRAPESGPCPSSFGPRPAGVPHRNVFSSVCACRQKRSD